MIGSGLTIIIPTTNREAIFLKTLDAVYNAVISVPYEIIVINDSKTTKVVIDAKYLDKVKVVDNPRRGLASVRNLGVKLALYDSILFIDDDILIKKDTISELIKLSEKHPGIPINFNWIYPEELSARIEHTQFGRYLIKNGFTSLKGWSRGLIWNDVNVFEPDLMASYFLLISKSVINSIGGYNDQFPQTAEDFEFAKALKDKNIVGLVDPINMVYHNEEDRVELTPWLQRKERGAATRRVSAALGYSEVALNPSVVKKTMYAVIYFCKPIVYFILKIIPNHHLFDKLYFAIVDRLLTAHLYHGYFKK
jgi:glycosyltransferase involved in cell wall biosynthesis